MNKEIFITLNKRYLTIGCILFILFSYLGIETTFSTQTTVLYTGIFMTAFLFASLIFFIIFSNNKPLIISIFLCVSVSVGGFLNATIIRNRLTDESGIITVNSIIRGIIIGEPTESSSNKSYKFISEIYSVTSNSKETSFKHPLKTYIYLPMDIGKEILKTGQSFECKVSYQIKPNVPYDGAFDYSTYLFQDKITSSQYTKDFHITNAEYPKGLLYRLKYFGNVLRNYIISASGSDIYSKDESALLKGILIGDKSDFSDELYNAYADSGFIHIASVSGTHISYILLLISALLLALKIPKRFFIFGVTPFLLLFCAVAQFTPSVCRASLMVEITLLSKLLKRNYDSISAISLTAAILVFENPFCLQSYSFLLSFSATLGILVFFPVLSNYRKFIKPIKTPELQNTKGIACYFKAIAVTLTNKVINYSLTSIFVSIGATIGISYFTSNFFKRITWGSIFGNIVMLPLVLIIFIGGYVNSIIFYISKPIYNFIAKYIIKTAIVILNYIATVFSNNIFYFDTQKSKPSFFVIYIIICISLYCIIKLPPRKDKKS